MAPIVLIRADEEVPTDQAVRSLLAQAKAKDPTTETTRLEAATHEPHQLDTLAPPSLSDEPRFVYVPALEQMADTLLSDPIVYVGTANPEVSIILCHNGGWWGKRLLGAIKASPYPIIQCEAVKGAKDKSSPVVVDVCHAGQNITPEVVGALADALGSDLHELYSAVDQLLADTQGTISVDHVYTCYAGCIKATGFTVTGTAATGNTPTAIMTLRHAVATGTDPMTIVAAPAMKVRQLARVTAAGGRYVSPAELGVVPWQVDRTRRGLQGWFGDALAISILAVAWADAEAKGASRNPVYAVERAVLMICNARRSGSRRH